MKHIRFFRLTMGERARISSLTKLADSLDGLKEEITAMKLRERIKQLHAIGNCLQTEIDSRG